MTNKILLTGATGFVGRQVYSSLAASSSEIGIVGRPSWKDCDQLFPNATEIIITRDLFSESEDWWAEKCAGYDKVIHVAWHAEPSEYLHSEKNMDCLIGSLKLAKGATRAGIKKFVGVGTCLEYDITGDALSTQDPLNPDTIYGSTKASLFLSLSNWFGLHSATFAWCRLFHLYGEGEHPDRLVAYIKSKIEAGETVELTSGSQIRDFLDVAVAGQMIAEVTNSDQSGALNICSGAPVTVRQMAEKVADDYGRRDLLRFGARPSNKKEPSVIVGIPSLERHP